MSRGTPFFSSPSKHETCSRDGSIFHTWWPSCFLRRAVTEFGQTVVMVTHDPVAAGYADAALFLADGRVVDSLADPTAAGVLDRLKALGG